MKGTALKEELKVKLKIEENIPYKDNAVEFKCFQKAWKQPCLTQFTK